MANGICIFAENYNGKLEPASAELVSAARRIQETTKEEISACLLYTSSFLVRQQLIFWEAKERCSERLL